jgi:hypothetical protein
MFCGLEQQGAGRVMVVVVVAEQSTKCSCLMRCKVLSVLVPAG